MRTAIRVSVVFVVVLAGLAVLTAVGSWAADAAGGDVSGAYSVRAQRQPLTTNPHSAVIHDTETNALVVHDGRLFAATDQWEYRGPSRSGQVLVKNARSAPWTVFEQTQSLRVQAMDSFAVPADQGLGPGHAMLVTQAIVRGHSRLQWLLDGARAFTHSFVLAANTDTVRAFGAHESGGVWAAYAGVEPTGILRGTWSRRTRSLVFGPVPELTVRTPGHTARKVTGFADCHGALYATINTKLYRRNDGTLARGVPRWTLVYEAPPVGLHNSGLRGLTCVRHDGSPSLLLSTEGSGDVYRFDHLPTGPLRGAATPGRVLGGIVRTLEFSPIPAIRAMLAARGTTVPATGLGAIHYVIAAYNNFEPLVLGGEHRDAFGFEWGYLGTCPATRTCQPARTFDAAACFAVRTDRGASQTYALQCLSGPQFNPARTVGNPIRSGEAFVSTRTIALSPFHDGRVYYGGYDCNFNPADGTAWIGTSALGDVHVGRPSRP